MAKKQAPENDDLIGDAPDDMLADKPAKKTPAKKAAPAAKKAAPAAKKTPAEKPAKKERAKPVARGTGKFYMDPDEKAALAKKIAANKKPVSTKDLAEKLGVPTWQVRRAISEVLVAEGKGSVAKVGNSLTYTPT